MRFSVLGTIIFAPLFLFSQINYVYEGYSSINKIYKINPDNSTSLVLSIPNNYSFTDIAISPSGTFYGINYAIYEIDINTGEITFLFEPEEGGFLTLVCSADHELYTINEANFNLYKYDIDSSTFEFVHHMEMSTDGDLTFYRGNLIFPSGGKIRALNLKSKTITDIYCLPLDSYGLWGLSNISEDCNTFENTVYSISSNGEEYCNYNFENNTRTCVDISTEFESNILGMASDNEHHLSNCDETQLTEIGCEPSSIHMTEWTESNLVSPNPFHEKIKINSRVKIEQLKVYDANGRIIYSKKNPDEFIDTSTYKAGIYFIQLTSQYGTNTEKIIKH